MRRDLEDVAEALRRDHTGRRALVLEHRVDPERRAVEERGRLGERRSSTCAIAASTPSAGSWGVVGAFAKSTSPVAPSRTTRSVNVPPTSTAKSWIIAARVYPDGGMGSLSSVRPARNRAAQPVPSPALGEDVPVRVGIDVGGTFTDLVALGGGRLVTAKVPSTPDRPGRGRGRRARGGRDRPRGDRGARARHDRRDERAARAAGRARRAVTTEGFRDVIEIGRQNRPSLYDLTVDRPAAARAARAALHRARADRRRTAWSSRSTRRACRRRSPRSRGRGRGGRRLPALLVPASRARGAGRRGDRRCAARTCTSRSRAACCPEFREYERCSTTAANAYLGPAALERTCGRLEPRRRW